MSTIVKIQEVGELISANNDNYYVLGSSLSNTNGFQYVMDVYLSGTIVPYTTLKSFPDPSTGYGVFNVKNILPTTLSFDFSPTLDNDKSSSNYDNLINTCENSLKQYYVLYGFSNYTSSLNIYILSQSISSGPTSSFFNASGDWYKNVKGVQTSSYYLDNYTINSINSASFLTNSPRSINTYSDMRQWLYFNVKNGGQYKWNIKTYNSSDTQLNSVVYSTIISSSTSYKMFRLATGPSQLNNFSSSFIDSNVSYYTVQIVSASVGNQRVSETFRYNVTSNCSPHRKYLVHWLNNLGGFDSFYFNYKSTEIVSVNKSGYNKLPYDLSTNGITLNNWNAGNLNYYINSKTKLSLSTDFITDNTISWLKELFTSPIIYIEDIDNNILTSAIIDDTNYELKKVINTPSKVFSLTLNFTLSPNNFSQLL